VCENPRVVWPQFSNVFENPDLKKELEKKGREIFFCLNTKERCLNSSKFYALYSGVSFGAKNSV